ncbi:hypothetical protein SESBI_42447 [Sesbania bispinosa]|nr:hypothetical protein SESBI_42447 [Sesbania bispinosa]
MDASRNKEQPNRALGFPALITALYASQGVEINPTKCIRPPLDKKCIDKHYLNPDEQQQADQLPQPPAP